MSGLKLFDKRIAIVATDGFEEAELFEPEKALKQAGAQVEIISLKAGIIKSWSQGDWGKSVSVDHEIDEVSAEDYDALMLPGGVMNVDKLRAENSVIDFVSQFVRARKPIAAICHAPWLLIEVGVANREMTSWPSLKTDLENAGAIWVDAEVAVQDGWVTSRKPADIPAFNKQMIEEFQAGPRTRLRTPESYFSRGELLT